MINANELRIGNWIYIDNGGKPKYEYQVTAHDIEEIEGYGADAFPVPLTPEVLERCGFKKLNFGKDIYSIRGNGIEISVNPELELVYIETDFGHARINNLPYPSLHQLQNIIYTLTQTELIYKS